MRTQPELGVLAECSPSTFSGSATGGASVPNDIMRAISDTPQLGHRAALQRDQVRAAGARLAGEQRERDAGTRLHAPRKQPLVALVLHSATRNLSLHNGRSDRAASNREGDPDRSA